MRHRVIRRIGIFALLAFPALFASGSGQYREYNISGIVMDTQKNPLPNVEILLRETRTSRSYSLKTKKDGTFRFVGLPHGVYKVVFKKEGYAEKEDEWKFEEPQEKMKRVEIPPVVLISQEILNEAQRLKQAAAEVQAAAEKIRLGEYDDVLTDLGKILEKNPEDSNALYLLGMAYLKKNMWAEAVEPFLQVTELAPKFPAAYYQLGVCYQQLEEPDKALASYQKAMALDSVNPDSPYNAGLLLFAESRVDEALELFEKALSLRPDDPAALEMIGRCLIHKNDFPKAVEFLEKARSGYAADPDKVKFLNTLITKLKEQIKKRLL